MEDGVRRWLVDISRWDPSPEDFSFLVSLLPAHENPAITRSISQRVRKKTPLYDDPSCQCMCLAAKAPFRGALKCRLVQFVKVEDKKRAFVSRMLQYSLVHDVFGIPFGDVTISRGTEGKPYLDKLISPYHYFNFNVSHSGNYVGIASDAFFLVGLDIVSIDLPRDTTIIDFIKNFKSDFTCLEWSDITKLANSEETLLNFYRYWCLKEAYVKALGQGLSFSLSRLEFRHDIWENIVLYIDGVKASEWEFWVFQLDGQHWASVARGIPQFARSYEFVGERSFLKQEFSSRTVEQLISSSSKVNLNAGSPS